MQKKNIYFHMRQDAFLTKKCF